MWEVTDDICGAAAPKGGDALLSDDTLEALVNAGVGLGETTNAEQLLLFDKVRYFSSSELIGRSARKADLILDEQLNTLSRSGASLRDGIRDGRGNTAYCCPTLLVFPL